MSIITNNESNTSMSASGTILRLTMLVRPWWKLLVISLLSALFGSLGAIIAAAVGALLISRASEGVTLVQIRPYLIAFFVLTIFTGILVWVFQWLVHYIAYGILSMLRMLVYDSIEPLAPAFINKQRSGDMISMIIDDIEFLEWYYAHTGIQIIVAVVVPIIVLVMLSVLHWILPFILLPFIIFIAGLPLYLRPRGDVLAQKLSHCLGDVNAQMVDNIQGLREIEAFGRGQLQLDEIEAKSIELNELQIEQGRFIGKQSAIIQVTIAFGMLTILIAGILLVVNENWPAHNVLLAVILAVGAFNPLLDVSNMTRGLNRVIATAQRLFTLIDEPVHITEKKDVRHIKSIKPTFAFENVTFHYNPDETPVLKDVSFSIDAGKTIALVGHSGAGKSTIASLLLRFWDPQHGRIMLGGHDLRDFTLTSLRDQIAIVQQDAYMFNTTIMDNIRIGKHGATNAEVIEAAKKAYMHDFIIMLPQGYDTLLGEHGAKLSGGQRQLISIARAILKDAPILILDEATSNLDAHSEQLIRDGITTLMEGRTTLIIAHRLSTIATADGVIVLDRGQVIETGTHTNLITQKGTYSRIVAAQQNITI